MYNWLFPYRVCVFTNIFWKYINRTHTLVQILFIWNKYYCYSMHTKLYHSNPRLSWGLSIKHLKFKPTIVFHIVSGHEHSKSIWGRNKTNFPFTQRNNIKLIGSLSQCPVWVLIGYHATELKLERVWGFSCVFTYTDLRSRETRWLTQDMQNETEIRL